MVLSCCLRSQLTYGARHTSVAPHPLDQLHSSFFWFWLTNRQGMISVNDPQIQEVSRLIKLSFQRPEIFLKVSNASWVLPWWINNSSSVSHLTSQDYPLHRFLTLVPGLVEKPLAMITWKVIFDVIHTSCLFVMLVIQGLKWWWYLADFVKVSHQILWTDAGYSSRNTFLGVAAVAGSTVPRQGMMMQMSGCLGAKNLA